MKAIKNTLLTLTLVIGAGLAGCNQEPKEYIPTRLDPLSESELRRLVAISGDVKPENEAAFMAVTQDLYQRQICEPKDFEKWGGWIPSSNHGENIYFAHCGLKPHTLYIDASKGELYFPPKE